MQRILIKDIKPGKEVLLYGFCQDIRDLGKIKFLLLRDISGTIQVIIKKDIKEIKELSKESVIAIKGKAVKNKQAPSGIEIIPSSIEVLAKASQPLPIDVSERSKTEISKRLDYRFLDLHNKKTQAIFKIQSEITTSFRNYFYKNGFIEIQPPSVISASSEGGTELFPVMYFEKPAYLAQSPQLYKQMCVIPLEKIFMITPVWRAEKHNTPRHLNESRQMDIEMAFAGQFEVMKELENVIRVIVKNVIENCKTELEILKINLKVPKAVYLSYEDAIKKVKGKIGEDFTPEQEKKLCELYPDSIVFTHSWPSALKPFYIMPKDEKADAKLSEGFDALYGGIEISSGGQRIHIPDLLIKRLKAKKLNPKNFESYIDSFRYPGIKHAGWSVGLERFTMTLLKLDNIREACLFTRDRDRLTP